MQRSANTACLAEARAYMGSAVSQKAIDGTVPDYEKVACAQGPVVDTKPTENAKGTSATKPAKPEENVFFTKTTLYFSPATRGAKGEWKAVECSVDKGSCNLVS